MGVTIFETMSALCRDGTRVNLGQGFPDDNGPPELLEAAARALRDRSSQYPPMMGVPELRSALADFYRRSQKLDLAPENIVVTSGGTEALAAAILAVVTPGSEVVVLQPAFDVYAPLVRRAGGVPVFVALAPPDWRYQRAEIEAAISPRTVAIILNDPLNPTGSVASEQELAMLSEVCLAHDLIAISDDVWESVRFDGIPHRSLLDLPGMAERTIKIGSAGKLFGLTGWKVGWIIAAQDLVGVIARAHQFLTFTTAPALQYAVAEGLGMPELIERQRSKWAAGRDLLRKLLIQADFDVLPGAATWFTCIRASVLDDPTFAERAVQEGRIATIPLSAFMDDGRPTGVVRLCHAKAPEVLEEGVARLAAFRNSLA